MTAAIMQPYFLPYIGYFQLVAAADVFVIYDNIKYTKKGWINRNRILRDGRDATFSLPLKKGSDALQIREREIAADFDRGKLLNQITAAYRKAPHYSSCLPLLKAVIEHDETNLFRFLHHSIVQTCGHLGINTPVTVSSTIPIDHSLCGADKVLAICRALGADRYINPIGGTLLYSRERFAQGGIALHFIESQLIPYPQFGDNFVPWLSILDVIMFNHPLEIAGVLHSGYTLTC
jgi:hypothetical protein